MHIDRNGSIWVAERWTYSQLAVSPGGDGNENDSLSVDEDLRDFGFILRKLDINGAELLSVDMSSFVSAGQSLFSADALNTDSSGNVYVCVNNWSITGITIHILDSTGNVIFQLDDESADNPMLISLPDGIVGYMDLWSFSDDDEYVEIKIIDFESKAFGRTTRIPNTGSQINPCGTVFDVLLNNINSNLLYGFNFGEKEPVELLNWDSTDVLNNIDEIIMTPDELIICINYSTAHDGYELVFLSKVPYSGHVEKTTLTLATFNLPGVSDYVNAFNIINPDYRIQVTDYSQFDTGDDRSAGLTRLTAEIIAGKIPDILDMSNLPYNQYANQGLLENLYTFIDSDPDMERSDFMENVFKASEINDGLYQIFPAFKINTIVGHPSVLGTGAGWNKDEFLTVLNAHPHADMPFGYDGQWWLTNLSFLKTAVSLNMDEFIDWKTGTVIFESDAFIQLLEFSQIFPPDLSFGQSGSSDSSALATPAPGESLGPEGLSEDELIATGRQIMAQLVIGNFWHYQRYKEAFGGDLVFKGLPIDNRNGNTAFISSGFAMTSGSENKEGVWEFLRMLLDKDFQLSYAMYNGFLTNKAAFNAVFEQADDLTQADLDKILALIDSTSGIGDDIDIGLWNIISESAMDYYSGRKSTREAAKIIQSRVSILVSERS
jgi:ABC-type glycerol-3-phosphate transport system substrate-binding protein